MGVKTVIWSQRELNRIQGLSDDSVDQDMSKRKRVQEEHTAHTQPAENESREQRAEWTSGL
jgi:hypothetical protein